MTDRRLYVSRSDNCIVHIITGLGRGGAENTLVNLLSTKSSFEHMVISLTPPDVNSGILEDLGIEVLHLGGGRVTFPIDFFRLVRLLRAKRPVIVQTWMFHADVLGGLAARMAAVPKVSWNLRHSTVSLSSLGIATMCVVWFWSLLSFIVPDRIVVSSRAAELAHPILAFSPRRTVIIENGVDCAKFSPQKNSNRRGEIVLGFAGRYSPQKGLPILARAIEILLDKVEMSFRLRMVGDQISTENSAIAELFRGVSGVDFLGPEKDMVGFYNSIDILVQPYVDGESFPNVVAEAMACGVPVIASDVGGVLRIVEDSGWVVSPGNPNELAETMQHLLAEGRSLLQARGKQARRRVIANFNLEKMVSQYENLYVSMASNKRFEGKRSA